jgi:predicted ATP-grasp superfamily ATP-dependent carboligase
MNLFYTGLGVARSLGEKGVRVIGLTAHRRIYGNFTRYAKTVSCPDSRSQPEELLAFLLKFGRELGSRAVLFPTRDDDLVFLDRYRSQLEPYFSLVMPDSEVLEACLNKWQTYEWAVKTGVAAPRAWTFEDAKGLERIIGEVTYPCVLKAVAAHHWRKGGNWELVGARKAIAIASPAELRAEYNAIAKADSRALIQEMVGGPDDRLLIAACYMSKKARWVAGFNTQKVLQIPEGFGTGCIVQSVARPEIFEPTARLLEAMNYSGVAEVEYKFDDATGEYKLIEINPRPWDQHRLGNAAGVDLMYLAYCEHAGLPMPAVSASVPGHKWIAEDTFVTAAVRSPWQRAPKFSTLLRLGRGKRIYAIWSWKDPLPSLVYWMTRYLPDLALATFAAIGNTLRRKWSGLNSRKKEFLYETHVEKP